VFNNSGSLVAILQPPAIAVKQTTPTAVILLWILQGVSRTDSSLIVKDRVNSKSIRTRRMLNMQDTKFNASILAVRVRRIKSSTLLYEPLKLTCNTTYCI